MRPSPGFTTLGAAANRVVDALAEALTEARGINRMLVAADRAEPEERHRIIADALRRACVLRDHLDTAERALR